MKSSKITHIIFYLCFSISCNKIPESNSLNDLEFSNEIDTALDSFYNSEILTEKLDLMDKQLWSIEDIQKFETERKFLKKDFGKLKKILKSEKFEKHLRFNSSKSEKEGYNFLIYVVNLEIEYENKKTFESFIFKKSLTERVKIIGYIIKTMEEESLYINAKYFFPLNKKKIILENLIEFSSEKLRNNFY